MLAFGPARRLHPVRDGSAGRDRDGLGRNVGGLRLGSKLAHTTISFSLVSREFAHEMVARVKVLSGGRL